MAAAFFLYTRQIRRIVRGLFGDTADCFTLPLAALLAVVLCALLWTFLSGIGGCFYQNEDHYGRNAIFHDLLGHSWPVYFDGTPYALDYYVGFWILPALVGKLFAALMGASLLWPAANAALFVQTFWFLTLIFLLMLSVAEVQTLGKVCLSLVLFVLFSGMDVLMARFNPEAWRHQIEWWAQCYQFSSNTTCLFWVYNQAVPAWLATMLLLSSPEDIGSLRAHRTGRVPVLSSAVDGADGVFHRHSALPPGGRNPNQGVCARAFPRCWANASLRATCSRFSAFSPFSRCIFPPTQPPAARRFGSPFTRPRWGLATPSSVCCSLRRLNLRVSRWSWGRAFSKAASSG